jgi:hypothetical protein
MAQRARVLSVEALRDVKAALAEFADAVKITLTSVDSDINRVSHWLTHDRPSHWKREVRRREDQVAAAQTDIMRKRLIAAPEPASVVEEQKALQIAKSRLHEAHKKLANVRRWAPAFEREALLYKGTCRGLSEVLHRELPRAAARLDRMVESLEAYARLAPPRGDLDSAPPPDSGGEAAPDPAAQPTEPPSPPGGPA